MLRPYRAVCFLALEKQNQRPFAVTISVGAWALIPRFSSEHARERYV